MWLLDFRPIDFQIMQLKPLWKLILENEKYYFELQWRGLVHDIMPGTEEQL
jgi:hypothetical protein